MNEQFGEKVKAIFDSITVLQAKDSDLKRDNANINGDSPMGAMLQYGANTAKEYNLEYLIKPAIAELHRDGWIHIHDLDFYAWTTTCTQIELRKLFKDGFNTGHGHLRAPKSIGSYAALAAIAIQSNQNDQHGGQSVVDFDYAMADGVRYTYQKYLKEGYAICERLNDLKDKAWILDYAMEKTTRDTYQAMEGFIHNLNTMHSRAGAQVPFSSINYGTDTSWEGRLAIEQLLLATEAGLGHGETPIFPIQIFRVKEGINYNPDDPNYDLFKLAMKVSAKRLFPNFAFIDAPFNLQYYKPGHPETEVAYMGCRTRVMGNVYDPSREIAPGRGKLIELCTDICKRYGKTKLLWFGDKTKTLNYEPASNEMVLTVHRWFANKSCPGDWMYARMGDLASKVTAKLGGSAGGTEKPADNQVLYRVQTGAFSNKENADAMLQKVKAAGFDTYMVKVDNLYKIQVGAFSKKANADAMATIPTAILSPRRSNHVLYFIQNFDRR